MQSGKKLEEMFFEYFMPDKYFGFRKASEKEDIEEGTDFFCDGLRFDLTEDFRGKDHMVQDKQFQIELNLPWAMVSLGIRTGNNKSFFKEAVVVIGVMAYSYDSAKTIVNELSRNWEQVSEKAFDLWCNYNDYVEQLSTQSL